MSKNAIEQLKDIQDMINKARTPLEARIAKIAIEDKYNAKVKTRIEGNNVKYTINFGDEEL